MNDRSNGAVRESDDVAVHPGVLEHQLDQGRIARRAYAIYESRHRADGHAYEDWLQAVSEYVARRESEPPTAFVPYGGSSSFADRTRNVRR